MSGFQRPVPNDQHTQHRPHIVKALRNRTRKEETSRQSRRLAGGRHRDDQHPRAGAPPRVRPGIRLHGWFRAPPAPLHLPLPCRRRRRLWGRILLLPDKRNHW